MKLMIVDDHAGVRNMIRQVLVAYDDTVCECVSADEAVRLAGDFKPDYVTMDLRMSGLCSFKGIRAIRESHPATRVIVVTSYDEPELRSAAIEAGAVGYVVKDNLAELPRLLNRIPVSDAFGITKAPPFNATAEFAGESGSLAAPLATRIEELELLPYFIASELRSPLQMIQNFVTILQQQQSPELPPSVQACVRRITEGCDQMDRRVEALLGFARQSRRVPQMKVVNTHALVTECWQEIRSTRQDLRAEFKTTCLPNVCGDADLLRIVFTNLLDNAVKFSAASRSPLIEVNCGEIGRNAVFAITDNGIGFDLHRASRLFLPLGRLHPEGQYPGTGLGLALARRIVLQHGGRLWAEAEVDRGATFFFTLPRECAQGTNQAEAV